VRAALVVVDPPGFDQTTRLGDRLKPMDVQTFISQRPVKRLNESVARGFAWPGEVDLNAMVIGPEVDKMAGKLGTIVSEYETRIEYMRQG
jgi:hypothetical protein